MVRVRSMKVGGRTGEIREGQGRLGEGHRSSSIPHFKVKKLGEMVILSKQFKLQVHLKERSENVKERSGKDKERSRKIRNG